MEELKAQQKAEASADTRKKGGAKGAVKEVDKSGRLTGYQHFTDKTGGTLNIEAMEAAAENAQEDINEDLFDVSDDDFDDLDDLDFDSSDEEDEDEEPDI